jgi:hypothetical protein
MPGRITLMVVSKNRFLMRWVICAALLSAASADSSAPTRPKHFVVALVDDLGGYNVPWRNPLQKMADDLVQLSTAEGMRLENFYTYKYCSPTR